MAPLSKLQAKERPTTDYERWLNFNPDEDPSSPPKYGPDRKHRYLDDSSVRFAPNRQLMFNDQRHSMPSGHSRHHRRISHSQGLVRGITFFSAVLVVVLVIRMFVLSLIRAAQRRRDIERQLQDVSQRQQTPTAYEDNNELDEL